MCLEYRDFINGQMSRELGDDGAHFWCCLNCGKQFKLKHHLKNHIEALHLQHMEYRCRVGACTKVCYSQPALRMHVRSHEKAAGLYY